MDLHCFRDFYVQDVSSYLQVVKIAFMQRFRIDSVPVSMTESLSRCVPEFPSVRGSACPAKVHLIVRMFASKGL